MPTLPPSARSFATRDELEAMLERTAPAVLELLQDGMPRSRRAIVAALSERHAKQDVARALMRLAVTDRVVERGGKFTLPRPDEPAAG
jgi:hypothetical protein